MNIKRYFKAHETAVKLLLLEKPDPIDWKKIGEKHLRYIHALQHERLIHLMVTLMFGIFLLIATAIAITTPNHQTLALMALFLVMEVPYVAHYFFLENTTQYWYALLDSIEEQVDTVQQAGSVGDTGLNAPLPDSNR